ncbi:MAG: hypothetical protein IJS45_02025 [Clostridia bacterium]|nr:hypothetical protein [Clostridia bacterium]
MKKYILLLIAASVLFSAVIVPLKFLLKETTDPVPADVTPVYSGNTENEYITVKEYNEKIGLFKNDEETPYKIIDVFTFTLPESDKAMLKSGFTIKSDNIESVIQDYTG